MYDLKNFLRAFFKKNTISLYAFLFLILLRWFYSIDISDRGFYIHIVFLFMLFSLSIFLYYMIGFHQKKVGRLFYTFYVLFFLEICLYYLSPYFLALRGNNYLAFIVPPPIEHVYAHEPNKIYTY